MALNSLLCADVLLRNCSINQLYCTTDNIEADVILLIYVSLHCKNFIYSSSDMLRVLNPIY